MNPETAAAMDEPSLIARELTGDLPCVRCRYNLRGLSVSGSCPECSLPIRATLLAVVDPLANEFQPIAFPRATAVGLIVMASAAFFGAITAWCVRLLDVAALLDVSAPGFGRLSGLLPGFVIGFTVVCGIGALSLVRPHARLDRAGVAGAMIGCACVLILAVVQHRVLMVVDLPRAQIYFTGTPPPQVRVWLRIVGDVCMLAATLGLAANMRQLVLRSVLLRTGAVDRQTMSGLAAAVGVILLGDLIQAVAPMVAESSAELLRLCGTLLIGLGSLLVTIGLALLVVDTVRLAPVVASKPLGIEDVLGPERGASV